MQLFGGFHFRFSPHADSATLPTTNPGKLAPVALPKPDAAPEVAQLPVQRRTRPQLSMVWVKGEDGRLMAKWTTQD